MPDRAAPVGKAPATREIEVTPEMIEAGIAAYYAANARFEFEDEIVKRIYLAMSRLAPG
jgi:hypothetical protein